MLLTSNKKQTYNSNLTKLIIMESLKSNRCRKFFKNLTTNSSKNVVGNKLIRSRSKKKIKIVNRYTASPIICTSVNILSVVKSSTLNFYSLYSNTKNTLNFVKSTTTTQLFSYASNVLRVNSRFTFLTNSKTLSRFDRKDRISNIGRMGKNPKYVRSNGTKAIVLDANPTKVKVRMPSMEIKSFSSIMVATIGTNVFSEFKKFKKNNVKFKRNLGLGSKVRGVAMNSVDHPHGGNTKSIRFPRTP